MQLSMQMASNLCPTEAAANRPLSIKLTTTAAGVLYENPLMNKATFISRLDFEGNRPVQFEGAEGQRALPC